MIMILRDFFIDFWLENRIKKFSLKILYIISTYVHGIPMGKEQSEVLYILKGADEHAGKLVAALGASKEHVHVFQII